MCHVDVVSCCLILVGVDGWFMFWLRRALFGGNGGEGLSGGGKGDAELLGGTSLTHILMY